MKKTILTILSACLCLGLMSCGFVLSRERQRVREKEVKQALESALTELSSAAEALSTLQNVLGSAARETDPTETGEQAFTVPSFSIESVSAQIGELIKISDYEYTLDKVSLVKDREGEDAVLLEFTFSNKGKEAVAPNYGALSELTQDGAFLWVATVEGLGKGPSVLDLLDPGETETYKMAYKPISKGPLTLTISTMDTIERYVIEFDYPTR